MPIIVSTHPEVANAPFLYGDNGAGSAIDTQLTTLLPTLNGDPSTILTTNNGALAHNASINVDFGSNQENIAVSASLNLIGNPGRGLFRVGGRKSTGQLEFAYFLVFKEVSTAFILITGGFSQYYITNLSNVTTASYLVAGSAILVASPL